MTTFRIQLFGRLAVYLGGNPLFVGLPTTKPFELLAYLLVYRQQTHSREVLATMLWPDLTTQQARRNLRKVLCTLQHFLSDARYTAPPLLLVQTDWIAINPAADLQLDIAALEQAYALARQQMEQTLDGQTAQIIADAVAIYAGELLTGIYADWCLYERERFENMYLELVHMLMVHAESRYAYEQAIAYGLDILRHDRANERTHYRLMRLYYLSGNRSTALYQYERCVTYLASDLGVRPGKYIEQLYQQICQDELVLNLAEPDTPNIELPCSA